MGPPLTCTCRVAYQQFYRLAARQRPSITTGMTCLLRLGETHAHWLCQKRLSTAARRHSLDQLR